MDKGKNLTIAMRFSNKRYQYHFLSIKISN